MHTCTHTAHRGHLKNFSRTSKPSCLGDDYTNVLLIARCATGRAVCTGKIAPIIRRSPSLHFISEKRVSLACTFTYLSIVAAQPLTYSVEEPLARSLARACILVQHNRPVAFAAICLIQNDKPPLALVTVLNIRRSLLSAFHYALNR